MAASSLYPAQLSIDYPEQPLNRLTTFFRGFTVIPIVIVFALIGSNGAASYGAGFVVAPTVLMLLFRA